MKKGAPVGPLHVYVASSVAGPQKIGISARPERRIPTLQANLGQILRTPRQRVRVVCIHPARPFKHARAIEQTAHRLLARKAVAREWFDVTEEEAIAACERASAMVEAGFADGLERQESADRSTKVRFESDLWQRIDEWRRRAGDLPTRQEAVRRVLLIAFGLMDSGRGHPLKKGKPKG